MRSFMLHKILLGNENQGNMMGGIYSTNGKKGNS
jgi:hypothetical protein